VPESVGVGGRSYMIHSVSASVTRWRAARAGLERRMYARWRRAGTVFEPAEHWAGSGDLWVWLPPADVRPQPGSGRSLQAVVAA
jgi:hypothetical protein